MDKKERFQAAYHYLKDRGMLHTQKGLAEKMESTSPNISSALKGINTVLTDNFLRRFNSAYGYIFNEKWLIKGEGDILRISQTDGDVSSSTVVGANASRNGNNMSSCDAMALSKALDEISEMRKIIQEQVTINKEQFERKFAKIEQLTVNEQ